MHQNRARGKTAVAGGLKKLRLLKLLKLLRLLKLLKMPSLHQAARAASIARACSTAMAQLLTRACTESERLVSSTGTRVPSTRPAVPAPASQVSSL
ncbi:hypothetical protein D3C71_1983900 [compost metagenome]